MLLNPPPGVFSTLLGERLQDLAPEQSLLVFGLATALLVGWLLVVSRLRSRLLSWIDQRTLQVTRALGSHRLRRVGIKQMKRLTTVLVRGVSALLLFVGTVVWLAFSLELFPFTHDLGEFLVARMLNELTVAAHAAFSQLPQLGVAVVIFFLARMAHQFLSHYFISIEEGDVQSGQFDAVTAAVTRRLAGVGLWLAALVIAYPYIPGSDSAAFKGVSILAGLMVSLGSTNLVGQLVNGLIVIYTRAVKPGDYIEVGDTAGAVESLGLFSCTVRAANEELIVIPNSVLAAGLKNFSRAREGYSVQFVATVTIGYDTPWPQVHDLLLAAANATAEVRHEPAPFVRQAALENFAVRYELVFAPAVPSRHRQVLSELHARIQDRFHAAGVQLMSPAYDSDPAAPKIPPVKSSYIKAS